MVWTCLPVVGKATSSLDCCVIRDCPRLDPKQKSGGAILFPVQNNKEPADIFSPLKTADQSPLNQPSRTETNSERYFCLRQITHKAVLPQRQLTQTGHPGYLQQGERRMRSQVSTIVFLCEMDEIKSVLAEPLSTAIWRRESEKSEKSE
ncbi:hypothetical protein RRG08_005767 [Elysia crispata]|uniref:Uncharacterized protein n=1 Tax=Elysia crispata TaxID=231223 RepID=A0AAE1D6Z0_9GAST|nr:hypothetical protein RRG08_005767 [Elysia crispata]